MSEPIPADEYLNALNEQRLLVFLECDHGQCEDSDEPHFHQVCLTGRQFKAVSDAVITGKREDADLKDGYEMVGMRLGGIFAAAPFDGLSSTI